MQHPLNKFSYYELSCEPLRFPKRLWIQIIKVNTLKSQLSVTFQKPGGVCLASSDRFGWWLCRHDLKEFFEKYRN